MVGHQRKRERRDEVHYKGVRMRKWGKWVAEVRQPKSRDRIWLGSYETAEEAARAYDAAVFCLRGPSVVLNFPDDPPRILVADELSRSQIQVAASKHARGQSADEAAADATESRQTVVENMFLENNKEMGSPSFEQDSGGGGAAVDGNALLGTSSLRAF